MENLRYPIGEYSPPKKITFAQIQKWIAEIEALPKNLRTTVEGMNATQLDTTYRPGGWTVRQVVHHLADSHLNSIVRLKLTLTENNPIIKPYDEGKWATTPEYQQLPVESSLDFLEKLHQRWVVLLKALSASQFERRFRHPEIGELTLAWIVGMYAWHGLHHLAHIENLADREGWKTGT